MLIQQNNLQSNNLVSRGSNSSGNKTNCSWDSKPDDNKFLYRPDNVHVSEQIGTISKETIRQLDQIGKKLEEFWKSDQHPQEKLNWINHAYSRINSSIGNFLPEITQMFGVFLNIVITKSQEIGVGMNNLDKIPRLTEITTDLQNLIKYVKYFNSQDDEYYTQESRKHRIDVAHTEVSLKMHSFINKAFSYDAGFNLNEILGLSFDFPNLVECNFVERNTDYNCIGTVFHSLGLVDTKARLLARSVELKEGACTLRNDKNETINLRKIDEPIPGNLSVGVMINSEGYMAHIFIFDSENPRLTYHKTGPGPLIQANPLQLESDQYGCFGYGKTTWYTTET